MTDRPTDLDDTHTIYDSALYMYLYDRYHGFMVTIY